MNKIERGNNLLGGLQHTIILLSTRHRCMFSIVCITNVKMKVYKGGKPPVVKVSMGEDTVDSATNGAKLCHTALLN